MIIKNPPQIGDPILRKKTKRVKDISSKETKKVIRDLRDTMRSMGLVGMAAPQIGSNLAVFVTEIRPTEVRKDGLDELRIFINPEIISLSRGKVGMYEGCGSILEGALFGSVPRSERVTVKWQDEKGVKHHEVFDGLLGEVIQHECDHLQGIMFMDRVKDTKTYTTRENYKKKQK